MMKCTVTGSEIPYYVYGIFPDTLIQSDLLRTLPRGAAVSGMGFERMI